MENLIIVERGCSGFSLSPRLVELEAKFKADGGTFEKFNIGELCDPCKTIIKLSKADLTKEGNIPCYSSESTNNGIIGYSNKVPEYLVDKQTPFYIVFGDHTRTTNFAHENFSVLDNVKVLKPKVFNEKAMQYICTCWRKAIPNLGYARHWRLSQNVSFFLPINSSGEIAIDYMELVIRKFEEECIRELSTFLRVSGLENTELTETEQSAVQMLRDGEIKWRKVKICGDDGIFDINNTHSIMKSQIYSYCSGGSPYCTASEKNNSIVAYIDYDKSQIERGNSIFIGGKSLVISYQENDYFSNDSHNIACYVKDKNGTSKNTQLFMVSAMYKSLKPLYSWNDSISKEKIQNDMFYLPVTSSGSIDWAFMESLINAEARLAIRGVIEWRDEVIAKTREFVTT